LRQWSWNFEVPSVDITIDLAMRNTHTVLTCSYFPVAWKMSKILPVSKILNPGELRDYRLISVLPALSKALEVVMRVQMI
jgi:hypothetical protein